ncbi:MAG: tetratricopeptide repeat protein [Acidobacteriota bacterium]
MAVGSEMGLQSPGSDSSAEIAQPSSRICGSGPVDSDEGFWVAVLPFACRAADGVVDALAGGLTEDIVTGLSRFSYLRVISHSSTLRYAGQAVDVRAVGKELGARYVMEGSIRQAGSVLRVAIQLVDADSGAHLWAETFNRPFNPDEIFDLQDDLVPRIVSTCADHFGVLARAISEAVRVRPLDEITPYEALMRGFGYHFRLSVAEHAEAREALERAVEQAPSNADCWAMLSWVYSHEFAHDFNPRAGSLDRALKAARRAVDLAPSNHLAQQVLAVALFFRKENAACLSAAERSMALNRLDGSNEAIFLITLSGEWERGCALIRRAMDLNPHHPGWYRAPLGVNEYRKENYRAAVDEAVKANVADVYWMNLILAAAYGQLGELAAARKALDDLLAQKEDFAQSGRKLMEKWFDPALSEHLMEGLCKAGLEIEMPGGDTTELKPPDEACEAQARGSIAIAVLPFADMSPAKDQDYFCEGMAEEIMNALVHIDGIRVASRTSTFKAVEQASDLKSIGRALGVGRVLEGSVRLAGNRLRVTAQLTEVESGYQLWSERFDREAEDVFAIQDEIAAGVVTAVTSRLDSGEHAVTARGQVGNIEAYRHYLKGRHYRYSKNDHVGALESYTSALALDPSHGPSWVGKAEVTVLAAVYSLIPAREACASAREALATAVRLQGESAEGCYVEGMIAFCEARWQDSEAALSRTIELQPTFVPGHCWRGFLSSVLGRIDEASGHFDRARELDPLAAYPYAMNACGLLTAGRFREADDAGEQAILFDHENTLGLWCSGMAKVVAGHFDSGVAALELAARQSRRSGYILGVLGWGLAAAGRREDAESILEEMRSRPHSAPVVVPEAWILAALADIEGAFEVLGRAEEETQAILYFAGMAPFDPLRDDPRFESLLERLGLPPLPAVRIEADVAAEVVIDEKSIAVLPFTNMSVDAENEYFSDGLTEEIIADLSKVGALRVISRTSAMQLKGAKKDVQMIGRELGVRYVLEGGVRKAGNSLRITAQLIDAETDAHLWSDKYSGTMDDVFEVQERVSREIVWALDIRLTSDENKRLAERPIADPRAFELYLQARQEIRRFDMKALDRAANLLSQAVEIEGETPPLVFLTALAKVTQAKAGVNPDPQQLEEAESQALALLEDMPDLPQAHTLLGSISYEKGRLPEAVWHCNRALEGTSNDTDAFLYLGASYMAAGQPELGLDAGRRMVACDPLASISWMILGAAQWFVDRFEEAVPDLKRSVELDPQNFLNHWGIGYTYASLGRPADAARHVALCVEAAPENAYTVQIASLVDALKGRPDAALERLAEIDITPLDAHNKFHLSESFAMAGDTRRALEILEIAVDQGFYPYPFINEYCPFMAPLRTLPDFARILAKSKEKTETFREDGPFRPITHDAQGGTR